MKSKLRRSLTVAASFALLDCGPVPEAAPGATPEPTAAVEITQTPRDLRNLSDDAVGSDAARAAQAIATLRASGERGWQEFRRRHLDAIEQLAERPACLCEPDSHERRVAAALDKIAGQRDAASSGLYWHTD